MNLIVICVRIFPQSKDLQLNKLFVIIKYFSRAKFKPRIQCAQALNAKISLFLWLVSSFRVVCAFYHACYNLLCKPLQIIGHWHWNLLLNNAKESSGFPDCISKVDKVYGIQLHILKDCYNVVKQNCQVDRFRDFEHINGPKKVL